MFIAFILGLIAVIGVGFVGSTMGFMQGTESLESTRCGSEF